MFERLGTLLDRLITLGVEILITAIDMFGWVQLALVVGGVLMVLASLYLQPVRSWKQIVTWILVLVALAILCVLAVQFFFTMEA